MSTCRAVTTRPRRRAPTLVAAMLVASGCGLGSTDGAAPPETAAPLPPDPTAVSVVAAGDISDCPSADCEGTDTAATASLVGRIDPDLVLTLGDNQYPSGELEDFEQEYAATWGRFLAVTRPAPGNHDYQTPDAEGYFDYFGPRAGPHATGYYSFDIGGWHVVALNSNDECEVVACNGGSAQQQWLADDLASTPRRCVLAYWHHPRWSTGEHGDIEEVDALWRTAVGGGVDIVLNGHDHDYERFEPLDADGEPDPNGTAELVVGTGGTALRPFEDEPRTATAIRIQDVHGVLRLQLGDGSYGWEFADVAGRVLDSGGPTDCS